MHANYMIGFPDETREEIEYTPEQVEELYKCSKDIYHFIPYFKIVNPDLGEITFEPYDYQKKLLNKFRRFRYNVALCSRQSGKTTVVSAYALWYAMFNKDKVIAIFDETESFSKLITRTEAVK